MREILFRGKRIDNGEWIEGSLINDGRCFIAIHPSLAFGPTSKDEINGETLWGFCPFFEVDPSTCGQYTGLTDKNGKKIFEGDIVEYPIEQGKYSKQNIHEVVFERRHGTAYYGIKMSDIETWGFDLTAPAKLMKVIGNVHDNPELLKVRE